MHERRRWSACLAASGDGFVQDTSVGSCWTVSSRGQVPPSISRHRRRRIYRVVSVVWRMCIGLSVEAKEYVVGVEFYTGQDEVVR